METGDTSKLLLEKYLGDRLNQVIRSEDVRCVLVASPRKGTGKTLFIELIKNYLVKKWPDTYAFIAYEQLIDKDPADYRQNRVIIDGFALNEGQESLNLPQRWQAAIDAAVLLVMGRDTTQVDINEGIARLDAMDIRPIGVVFNAFHCPAWSESRSRTRFWQTKPIEIKPEANLPIDGDRNEKSMGYLKLDGLMNKETLGDSKKLNKKD